MFDHQGFSHTDHATKTTTKDDGHGPKYGCTYQACGNPNAEVPCPFVKDDVSTLRKPPAVFGHQHEYMLVCSCGDIKHITTPKSQHGIVTFDNRGEKWMD